MVETFLNIDHHPSILRIDGSTDRMKMKLPPFLKVIREVTDDNHYETWFMADNDYMMPEKDV